MVMANDNSPVISLAHCVRSEQNDGCKTLEQSICTDLEKQYRSAARFFRDKEEKAFHVPYQKRIYMAALSKQIAHGSFEQNKKDSDVGFFDLFGQDRNEAWKSLENKSREDSMKEYINSLLDMCPQFAFYYAAEIQRQSDSRYYSARSIQALSISETYQLRRNQSQDQSSPSTNPNSLPDSQIRDALNQQTFGQFNQYAMVKYANDPQKRDELIKQLQEKHFHEYMTRVHSQFASSDERGCFIREDESPPAACSGENEANVTDANTVPFYSHPTTRQVNMLPASIWTRRDIKDFKESIRRSGDNGTIRVGYGETVTVRVPTHDDGNSLFWEFATDNYDIGFGLFFEWTVSDTNVVSVHVCESEDDDDDDEADSIATNSDDVERGARTLPGSKPAVDQIIPVYRRDCHEEVYAGSHPYPGRGVYLLKFDNCYSLWRSKTLYYRSCKPKKVIKGCSHKLEKPPTKVRPQ
ncbi:Emp24/gp25L/p24 family protein [Trichinella nativa]|uniref:Emp24/gp25L/p24 family protein n=1 Tax=Trichinella nativa TaxID=6335 RepID=A0A1Y3EGD4_9BILA|nr:Emp24/gp25L/p24 family protein [Trichinella nativa]